MGIKMSIMFLTGLGFVCMIASVFLAFGDPRLPIPLAICGAGLFVGGSILDSKR